MLNIKHKYRLISNFRSLTSSLPPPSFNSRHCSTRQNPSSQKDSPSFEWLNQHRHDQARRSVLVQVNSEKSFEGLQYYCEQIAKIRSAHHYSVDATDSHFILLEFETVAETNALLEASSFAKCDGVPVKSHFLWFSTGSSKSSGKPTQNLKLTTTNGTAKDDLDLYKLLLEAPSIADQMRIVYEKSRMTDLGIRLKFLAAQQVQNSFRGIFPHAVAHPFGSSVNGFGKGGCDLDLILRLGMEHHQQQPESRLIFQTKTKLSNGRAQAQICMESIADVLKLFLPGVNNVVRILNARVPIIKYKHEYLDLEVDLSLNNMTGAYMSELLYLFGQIDDRVRPLVFCVRRWAQSVRLTNNTSPGRWITNFSLTLLVLFFLQAHKSPVLPSLRYLVENARPEDVRITEDNVNCTFLRDISRMNFQTSNKMSTHELLVDFFDFYSSFDFQKDAISLIDAKPIRKPEHAAIFIVNPIQPSMNVSKNVSMEERERLIVEVRNAAWFLSTAAVKENREDSWGLARLFKMNYTGQKAPKSHKFVLKSRMLELADIFEVPEDVKLVMDRKEQQRSERTRTTGRMKAKSFKG